MAHDTKDKVFDYKDALVIFKNQKYISTAKIQRQMKVSYPEARGLLDALILDGFVSKQVGSYPSIFLRGRFKKLKSFFVVFKTRVWIFVGYRPDPQIFDN